MRKALLTIIFLLGPLAAAKDKNPADYPLTAHVISATGAADANPLEETSPWTVRLRIGNLTYTGGSGCLKTVQVGTDVHARLGKRKLYLLTDDGRVCETRIESVTEAQPK